MNPLTEKQTSPKEPGDSPRSSLPSGSAPIVAVLSPSGDVLRVFKQAKAVSRDQEGSLLAWAWHDDKPAGDFTPCRTPDDTITAREKGYRVITGTFMPNTEPSNAGAKGNNHE